MAEIKVNGRIIEASAGERLSDALVRNGLYTEHICGGKGICRKCMAIINGEKRLICQYIIEDDAEIIFEQGRELFKKTEISAGNKSDSLALDIGSTTLALAAVDSKTGEASACIVKSNPQKTFGADVISRIEYASKNGVEKLQSAVIEAVNKMISELGSNGAEVLFASGNLTMLHLFAGIDPSSMGTYPYKPQFTESKELSAKDIGIKGVEKIVLLPSVSAFIGADIVAGINAAGIPSEGKYKMLVDLGTNAEIVLYSQEGGICTSAAAGPCFEGANISCGMNAVRGAIESFEIEKPYGKSEITVIGAGEAEGICATGLIDVIAELLDKGIVDKTGYMSCEEYEVADEIFIRRADIREYQLAKSAVISALKVLINIAGIKHDDIEEFIVSGGFSCGLNIGNAVKTGLLPDELKDKLRFIKNSSLQGTALYAKGKQLQMSFDIEDIEYIDLSENECFKNAFINNMEF